MHPAMWKLIWGCWLWVWVCGANAQNFTSIQGYQDKLLSTKQQLSDNMHYNVKDKKESKISISELWTISMKESVRVVRMRNHTLVLDGLGMWSLHRKQLSEVAVLPQQYLETVLFIKSLEWQANLFFLVCLKNNRCNLLKFSHDFKFSYQQSFSDVGIPKDAQIFIQKDRLFFVVLFQTLDSQITQIRLYQWHHTYLDQVVIPDITSPASSITVFNFEEDILLVLICSGNKNIKYPSQVWRRKPNGEMKKVQFLPTSKPLSVTHFVEREENFLLVMEDNEESAIYWWEGTEFVKWMTVEKTFKHLKVSASNTLHTTFLAFTQGATLQLYLMNSESLEKVFETDLKVLPGIHLHPGKGPIQMSILSVTLYKDKGITYMLVHYKIENEFFLKLFQIHVNLPYGDSPIVPSSSKHVSNGTRKSLSHVIDSFKALEDELHTLDSILPSLLFTNKPATINTTMASVSEIIEVLSGDIRKLTHTRMDIVGAIRHLSANLYPLRQEIKGNRTALHSVQVVRDRLMIFHGHLHLEEARINSLVANTVNEKPFEPQHFLSLTNNQRLDRVEANVLRINWLALTQIGEKLVQGLLLEDSIIRVPVRSSRLESKNLQIKTEARINGIMASNLTNKGAVTVESGENGFNTIAQVASEPSKGRGLASTLQLLDNSVIANLNVDEIDTTPIIKLISSLFIANCCLTCNCIQNIVHGNLLFRKNIRVKKLISNSQPKRHIPSTVQYIPQQVPLYYYIPFPGRRIRRENADKEIPVAKYKVKVKIIGNLKVHKLLFQNSTMMISNRSVPTTGLEEVFWTKNTPQVIPRAVHFDGGVSLLDGLENPIINGKNLTRYATTRSTFRSIVFENVHVYGNVSTQKDFNLNNTRRARELTPFKCAVLEVKHLNAGLINGVQLRVNHILNKGLKIVTGNLSVKGDLRADLINAINVTRKFETAVYVDKDSKLSGLTFNNITASSAEVELINKQPAKSLLQGFVQDTVVNVEGNLHVKELADVRLVNNKSANLSLVVNIFQPTTIYGKKTFLAQVSVHNYLDVIKINNMMFGDLFGNLLRNSTDQVVTGSYFIRNASINKLSGVSEINDLDIGQLVFVDEPQVNVTSNIHFPSLRVDGNMTASTLLNNCTLPKLGENGLVFERPSVWSTLQVTGDAEWQTTGSSRLQQLLDSAVTTSGNQTITGAITFSDTLFTENVRVVTLNKKNISFIFQDSLFRNKENQVISGIKHFLEPFRCKHLRVRGNAMIKSVNDININDINEKLVRHDIDVDDDTSSIPILGHKVFKSGFKAFSLLSQGGINGIQASSLATLDDPRTLPPLVVKSMVVMSNLQVETVNDFHLDSFLKECIYLNHNHKQRIKEPFHVKGNVTLQGPVSVPEINNISSKSLVFVKSRSSSKTKIKHCKTFSRNIHIETNTDVHTLNGKHLSKRYEESVDIYQNITINGSMVFLPEVELDTIYAQKYFVGKEQLLHLNKTLVP